MRLPHQSRVPGYRLFVSESAREVSDPFGEFLVRRMGVDDRGEGWGMSCELAAAGSWPFAGRSRRRV